MRPWILISLLFLSVLMIHEAQGIRLISTKGSPPDVQHISHKTLKERSNDGVEEVILCKGNQCSGRVRKLMVDPISSTTTVAKNQKDNNKEKISTKEENLSVHSSSTTEQRQPAPAAPETYPGVLDIAGMDYSQARRKPPIHN